MPTATRLKSDDFRRNCALPPGKGVAGRIARAPAAQPDGVVGDLGHSGSIDSTVRTSFMSSGAVHFSTKGEYGVRLMVELARHHGEGPVSLADVAEHEDLPRPYLEQLVVSLREADLVVSHRGARGGYTLSRDPREIRMGDVLRALEGPIVPMICAAHDRETSGQCGRTTFCTVNTLWVKVRDAINAAVDSLSLADLASPPVSAPGVQSAQLVV